MISVVTPSYNQLDWLRLAIASVADQETDTYEHLIQDAGTPGLTDSLQGSFRVSSATVDFNASPKRMQECTMR